MGTWDENRDGYLINKINWRLGGFIFIWVSLCIAGTMDYNDHTDVVECKVRPADYGRESATVCAGKSTKPPVGAP